MQQVFIKLYIKTAFTIIALHFAINHTGEYSQSEGDQISPKSAKKRIIYTKTHEKQSFLRSFVFFYGQFRKPCSDEDDPKDKVRNKLKHYNLMLSYCNPDGEQYQKLKKEKEEWLKSLHLDESKIVDKTYELQDSQ